MPVDYARDDSRHRVRITLRSPISRSELAAVVERQLGEGAWGYGTLSDARTIHDPLTIDDVRELFTQNRELTLVHGQRGPLAVVARDSGVIGGALVYSSLAQRYGQLVEIFWDVDEAERWLDKQHKY